MASWGMGTLPNSLALATRRAPLYPVTEESDAHRVVPSQMLCPLVPATPLLQAGTPAMDAGGPSAADSRLKRPHGRGESLHPRR